MTTEERIAEIEQRCKSNAHRIDELAGDVKVLADLDANVWEPGVANWTEVTGG